MTSENKTTLTSENLELIQKTAVKAAGAANRVVRMPGEAEGVFGVLQPDGTIARRFAHKHPRRERLLSIAEIAGAMVAKEAKSPLIWYAPDLVTVVLDDATDRPFWDSLYVPLEEFETEQWQLILGLANQDFGQKEFVKTLRHQLWDCLGEAGAALLRQVRALDWSMGSHTSTTIEKTRASYGRDVESEVRSKHGEMPDDLRLSVRIYRDPALSVRRTVKCAFEADPVSQKFHLAPYAGEIERALDEEMQHLRDLLEGEVNCPVLYGKAEESRS